MENGLHVGAQIYVSIDGEPVLDAALGLGRPGVAMTTDTLMVWFSSTKAITSVAAAQLWEAGKFDLDDAVAEHIPEFGQGGKDSIRIRHLFTHTAGFRLAGRDAGGVFLPWDEMLRVVLEQPLEEGWVPGQRAGYHAGSTMLVLGELVQRYSGLDFADYVRQRIFCPLGLDDCWIGMPPERHATYGDRIGVMHDMAASPPRPMELLSAAAGCALSVPGAGGRGPMRELGRFYEMLLAKGALDGTRILRESTVDAMTSRQRVGMHDETFGIVIDWGLGLIIDGFLFGRHSSPRTFGHGGARSSVGFCDPDYGLVVALVFNGLPEHQAHYRRQENVTSAIYEDLGLAAAGASGRSRPFPKIGLL